ncbi:hypothetical protein GCM10022393_38210 [Aquimarina addita]|uniref:Outer membrane protein beta-barrel domain-containing protein n=1 Tax=Aquimarina addita TaxID=870485 RepID=A0ABP6USW9_9FLAO
MRITRYIIYVLMIFTCQLVKSQSFSDPDNPWILGFGLNAINDSGGGVKGLFNVSDNYNYSNPYRISVEKRFADHFGLEVATNLNRFLEGKTVNGRSLENDIDFIALDGSVKFYFTNFFVDVNRSFIEGYMAMGAGKSFYDGTGAVLANVGFGVNYYVTEIFRLNTQVTSKFSTGAITNELGSNYIQINIGFIIRIYKKSRI